MFCAKSAGLIARRNAMIAYMEKNKDWCAFPDEAIDSSRPITPRTPPSPPRPAQVAAKIKKMKEQAAQGGGGPQAQPLPAGPL